MDSPPPPPAAVFSVRVVSLDYYMAPPIPDLGLCYSPFHGGKVQEVPVIRIYGSTPAGQKACLHVHRALPYLYIPCPNELLQNSGEGSLGINALLNAVEKALKDRSASKKHHVHGCTLVRAKKLYGYHSTEEFFVKIYLYYPHEVGRLATLLLLPRTDPVLARCGAAACTMLALARQSHGYAYAMPRVGMRSSTSQKTFLAGSVVAYATSESYPLVSILYSMEYLQLRKSLLILECV